ncbi:MAG TPA: helix-turn-helix domain-containing protein [Acidimicrobiia bacterium]
MAEMTFGRSIRYRRTKLGLSQTRLGELVGRSAAAVRSWEKDASTPSDPSVLEALSAVLGIEVAVLFEKAGVDSPLLVESSPTIEESLGELAPVKPFVAETAGSASGASPGFPDEVADESDIEDSEENLVTVGATAPQTQPTRGFVAPRGDQYLYATPAPPVAEATYMEEESQRQLYRIRHLATLVVFVALLMMLIWATGNGWDAFTAWWADFVSTLKL